MAHLNYILLIITVAIAFNVQASCLPEKAPKKIFFVADSPEINARNFAEHVAEAIGDKVMGYAAILRGKNGRLLASVEYGWAQTPCERSGGRAFTVDTLASWASVTKVITAATVLNKIDRFNTRSLDERMIDHLPEGWDVGRCSETNGCWKDVKIRHLLSHRAGFDKSINTRWKNRFASGESEKPVGADNRFYTNEAFSIWHYMGSFFAGKKMQNAENSYTENDGNYSNYIFDITRSIWTDYLDKHIFGPSGMRAACGDVDFDGNNFALLYDGPDDETAGFKKTPSGTQNCASGGMVMSAKSMSKFYHTLVNTDRILSRSLFESTLQIDKPELMGFDGRKRMSNGEYSYQKNGGSNKGKVGSDSMYFTDGLTAVLVRNSKKGVKFNFGNVLPDAYEAGQQESNNGTGIFIRPD